MLDRAIRSDDRAMWSGQTGTLRWAAIAAWACLACARDGGHDPGLRIDHADRVVLGIDDEHVAGGIHGHFLRCIEHGMARVVAVAGVAACSGAGDQFDDAVTDGGASCCLGVP